MITHSLNTVSALPYVRKVLKCGVSVSSLVTFCTKYHSRKTKALFKTCTPVQSILLYKAKQHQLAVNWGCLSALHGTVSAVRACTDIAGTISGY